MVTVKKKAVAKKTTKRVSEKPVKCWRALTPLKVGTSQLDFGDLIPEAVDWPNIGLYLRAEQIETVFVTQEEIDESVANRTEIETEEPEVEEPKAGKKKSVKTAKRVVKRKKEKTSA